MPQQKKGERVLGPYAERDGFKLIFVAADETRSSSRIFPTEEEACAEKERIEREIAG